MHTFAKCRKFTARKRLLALHFVRRRKIFNAPTSVEVKFLILSSFTAADDASGKGKRALGADGIRSSIWLEDLPEPLGMT
jgi:hypothetical protein